MVRLILAFGVLLAIPGATQADAVLDLLDSAEKRAWAEPDPRQSLAQLVRATVRVNPTAGVARARAASDRLRNARLAPARHSTHAAFAQQIAPHDRALRDELLRRAIVEADAALADDAVWRPIHGEGQPGFLGARPDRLRQWEGFRRRLWACIVGQQTDRAAAVRGVEALLADARAAGGLGGDTDHSFDDALASELADLDPQLLLALGVQKIGWYTLPTFCGWHANARLLDGRRDDFTRILITYAAENGFTNRAGLTTYARFDPAKALALATRSPANPKDPGDDRGTAIDEVITHWAWQDPDAALAAAEAEPDPKLRRSLIDSVARVWAYKRPETIGRAVRGLESDGPAEWLRAEAADELARRRKGRPPRDSLAKSHPPMTREERLEWEAKRRAAGYAVGDSRVERILKNPTDTSWLSGEERQMYLEQTAGGSYADTGGRLDTIRQIISGLRDQREIDGVLCYCAERVPGMGAEHAAELLMGVRSNVRYVGIACAVAIRLSEPPNP